MVEKIYLTELGQKKLKEELHNLREVARAEIATKIKDARDLGDVLENTVYDSTLDEQAYIEGRISEIESTLANSDIISDKNISVDIVGVGSVVVVESDGNIDEFAIVGSAEADPMKRHISNESPVGKALIGARKNQLVEVKTPIFTVIYKVIDIK
ncbi:transcription elongation factor GreA [candidate division WWE3 bacterium CG_4_9_14_0_2_um_filter_35_11]|uniref:Transcription elongation factor GreA n=1 Tax=candidate division WWE3 bacterium CG_4_9_14_0_2_um_filter_35_11 TaxID=1975077 RepID=A0A2M8EMI4_UNCKA|nr:MAG: transcription elongation factor GreA [candidate division WWE3 bacterium CG10_big_fil_rev_8_21_14_0_10_35_32]PJC23954.1 MAG: transcription elongation factor GreA [candidate division WWE3 bacterium CG_4_9_14_0_2_um_filter_35_11]